MSTTFETESLTSLHWVGIALAAITGVIHVASGIQFGLGGIGASLLLAGLGFFGAITLLLLGLRRDLLYLVGIPYTAVQIVIYYALFGFPASGPALADKVVQVALIAVLITLYRRESASGAGTPTAP